MPARPISKSMYITKSVWKATYFNCQVHGYGTWLWTLTQLSVRMYLVRCRSARKGKSRCKLATGSSSFLAWSNATTVASFLVLTQQKFATKAAENHIQKELESVSKSIVFCSEWMPKGTASLRWSVCTVHIAKLFLWYISSFFSKILTHYWTYWWDELISSNAINCANWPLGCFGYPLTLDCSFEWLLVMVTG